jgi:TldD protein
MDSVSVTDQIFFAGMGIDPENIRKVAARGLEGANIGELFLERTVSQMIAWENQGARVTNTKSRMEGFGFRYIAGDAFAYINSDEISEKAIAEAAQSAGSIRHAAAGSIAISSLMLPQPRSELLYPGNNPFSDVSDNSKRAFMASVDSFVRGLDSSVTDVGVTLISNFQAVQIIGQDGSRVADLRPLTRCIIDVKTEKNGRRESGNALFGGRIASCAELFQESVWQHHARDALRISLLNQDSVDSPSGQMVVVMGPGWNGVLLHEALGHPLEGDAARKKATVFHDMLGKMVAIPDITVIDQGDIPYRRGSLNYDDEGTKTQKTVLIENGKLVRFIMDKFNGLSMGVPSTGNGRRESYKKMPIVRMTNTYMANGSHTPAEIMASLKNVPRAIYAAGMGGGQVDPVSGKFVFELTEAYLVENGNITAPLKGVTLIGKAPENLTKITMVGHDSALDNGTGTCGKEGQSVPVGVGQPTIRMDGITVGGTAPQ